MIKMHNDMKQALNKRLYEHLLSTFQQLATFYTNVSGKVLTLNVRDRIIQVQPSKYHGC